MGQKYYSDVEGYADLFIEVSDQWLMREVKALADAGEEEYFSIFNQKVEAMFLRDTVGKEFTNPRTFAPDDVLDFDVALAGFVGSVLTTHVRRRKSLGGLSVRTSQVGSDGVGLTTKK